MYNVFMTNDFCIVALYIPSCIIGDNDTIKNYNVYCFMQYIYVAY